MAPHSSTLAWKIPWTEEPGGLQSMRSLRVGHYWSDLAAAAVACSYITLYKTIFIHLYLCISIRITLTVNRYGNIKTGWPNRTSNPVTVKVWHGKGFFFFFFKLTKSLIFLSFFFFFWPSIWDSQEIITTPYLLPPTLCFLISQSNWALKIFSKHVKLTSYQPRTQKFPLILNFFSYLYLKAHQMTTVRTTSLKRGHYPFIPCWNWKLYFAKTNFRSQGDLSLVQTSKRRQLKLCLQSGSLLPSYVDSTRQALQIRL